MLSVAPSIVPDALADTLAGLVAMLHPNAGMGSRGVLVPVARRTTRKILRELRHHLYESSLLLGALRQAEPACLLVFGRLAGTHQELRRLSHDLCRRLRRNDLRGARDVARAFTALFLEHSSGERTLVVHIFRTLDPAATGRFAEALLARMLGDLERRGEAASLGQSVVDLHSHDLQRIRQLQGRTDFNLTSEVHHENPSRR
jgi:hypothetical protein